MRQIKRIILEGPDGSGKSVLAEHLLYKFHNLELIKNEKGPNQDFSIWWPEQLERLESPIIPLHDRFFYSELIYGPILRGRYAVDGAILTNVNWFLRCSALLVYCRPAADTIRHFIGSNPQMSGVHDKINELIEYYDEIMAAESQWYSERFIRYDWENDSYRLFDKKVEAYLGEHN